MKRTSIIQRIGTAAVLVGLLSVTTACGADTEQEDAGDNTSETTADSTKNPSLAQDETIRQLFPEDILESGTLRVGASAPVPPHAMLEGENLTSGLDHDLLLAVAQLAGLEADFSVYPFESLMPALQADRIDVTGTILPSSDRLTVADFVIWFKVPYGLLLTKGNPHGIQGASDLCGYHVALVNGSTPPQMLVEDRQGKCQEAGNAEIKTTLYSDQDSAILAVKTGQADAFIQGESFTAWIAQTADDGESFTSIPDLEGLNGTVYFTDGFAVLQENQELLRGIQAGLQYLVDDGYYQQVLDKYAVSDSAVSEITINELSEVDAG